MRPYSVTSSRSRRTASLRSGNYMKASLEKLCSSDTLPLKKPSKRDSGVWPLDSTNSCSVRDERKSQDSVDYFLLKNTASEMVAGRYLYESARGVTDGYGIRKLDVDVTVRGIIPAGDLQTKFFGPSERRIVTVDSPVHYRAVYRFVGAHCVLACKNERACSLTPYIARRENGEVAPDEQVFGEISGVTLFNLELRLNGSLFFT
ncbi:hypothetical protein EDD85DRAFT_786407 [Armillaria nabsnona]|nr:hypothetical protein EDD85DRAFT_786407 [Armillaria nabsnona]